MFFNEFNLILTLGVFALFVASLLVFFTKALSQKIYYLAITVISGASIVGALIYEYFYLLDPCYFCWVERIFLFPLFLIALISYLKNIDKNACIIMISSLIGLGFSLYHTYAQYQLMFWGNELDMSCSLTGPSCIGNDGVAVFGFMTIPAMGVFTFLAMILLSFAMKKSQGK